MAGTFTFSGKRVFVAGHRGMVGSALCRRLEEENCELVYASRSELNLADREAVRAWLSDVRPDAVFVAAAKVGGIQANASYPADFLYENLMIEANLIEGSARAGVAKLMFLGSSCIYPKFAPQPISEDSLLTGALEPTNEWYAIAKIAGIKLCQAYRRQYDCDFITVLPCNLYGPGDNYDLANSHVLPALIRKAHEAKARGQNDLEIWGTGSPRREFLHADDLADALVFVMSNYSEERPLNIGSGEDLTIAELARLVMEAAALTGEIVTDPSKPDGTPRKLLDSSRLYAMGWKPKIDLREGIAQVFRDYLQLESAEAR